MASHLGTGPQLNPKQTRGVREFYSNMPVQPGPKYVVLKKDYLESQEYAAGDWTITEVDTDGDSGESRGLAANELNGALAVVNNDNALDLTSMQQNEETWKLASGKQLWFATRVKWNDADQVDSFVGLAITDTTPLDTTDRIGFQLSDGDASIDVLCEKDGTETITDSGVDAVDATYNDLWFHWDGVSTVKFFVDEALVATHTTNIPDNENLALTIHLKNGEAAAQSVTIDYFDITMER